MSEYVQEESVPAKDKVRAYGGQHVNEASDRRQTSDNYSVDPLIGDILFCISLIVQAEAVESSDDQCEDELQKADQKSECKGDDSAVGTYVVLETHR